ncbi:Holliday junction branch migration protein RuvA [Staphylococcus felis]|uniref:Holliday junction branch migration protein RuvA n=1 Tax=Staphylococcus felis TaxID=46127 RepID=UPI000CD25E7F|nr:Holliday junction branch migration protein RuvA [Staphylococcus felis]AVP37237.1 Holliday junction branch migration protein RuvA [Staphylococcus felis]PNZ37536.1 Holliday junction branch migration protein RuvA [Staphylococcus felis]QQB02815.1 Holliday junction branch migration protein RuvA [Staphylococcus felis]REI07752.1 Holliday junction branch migration protein RuvA [Staphylococcus felis]
MYAYLYGEITELNPTHIVIETTSGVAYEVHTPNSYRFQKLINQKAKVHTTLIVRDDAHLLYGFINQEEKDLFASLIKVTGIGPKSALAILAASTPSDVKLAIENENDAYLTQFPGIGKKTARQIILDLKGKVVIDVETEQTVMQMDTSEKQLNVQDEAMLALEALGYSKRELNKVEKQMKQQQFESVDDAVKFGLKQLIK